MSADSFQTDEVGMTLFPSRGDDDRHAERKIEVVYPETLGGEQFAENAVEGRDIDVVFRLRL